MRGFEKEIADQVLADYEAGRTFAEISDLRGISRDEASLIVRQSGRVPARGRRLTIRMPAEAADDYARGASVHSLGRRYGVSDASCKRQLAAMGCELRGNPACKSLPAEAADDYEGGMSLAEVGVKYGVCAATVRRELDRMGCPVRTQEAPRLPAEAADDYEGGMSLAEVGVKYGVCAATVRRRLEEMGCEIRGKGPSRGAGGRKAPAKADPDSRRPEQGSLQGSL